MRSVILIFLLALFPKVAKATTVKEVKAFIKALKTPKIKPCVSFLTLYPKSQFNSTVKSVAVLRLYDRGDLQQILKFKADNLNEEALLCYAKALYKLGKKRKALNIFKKLFRESNAYDADIITFLGKDSRSIFSNSAFENKAFAALKRRDFDDAWFYLEQVSFPGDRYFLLKGLYFLKLGEKKKARSFFLFSDFDSSFYYLLLSTKNHAEQYYDFILLLNSSAPSWMKISASKLLLEKFLRTDLGFFRKVLNLIKGQFPNVYKEFTVKYYVKVADYEKAAKALKELKGDKYEALKVAIEKVFFAKNATASFKNLDFYSLIFGQKKPSFVWKEPSLLDIKDEGIRYAVATDSCFVLNYYKKCSASLVIGKYLCGDYRGALKALNRLKKFPEDLRYAILYPRPALFKNDVIALSIARQESLFNGGALSRAGAIGIMQIMPSTGKYLSKKYLGREVSSLELFKSDTNVYLGSKYIRELMKTFGSFPLAAAAYNAGPGRVKRYIKPIFPVDTPEKLTLFLDVFLPIRETRNYVKKVVKNCYVYSYMLGKPDDICSVKNSLRR